MFKSIFSKTLYSMRWALLGWTAAVVFIVFLTMALYNSFSGAGIDQLVNSVPDSLKSLVGSVADFKTVPGYIGQQIFGPNVVVITMIMSIMLFISVSASEEDSGRLQSLLTLPVTRSKVYFQKWLAVVCIIGIVCLSILLGLWLGLLVADKTADYGRILLSIFDAWLMNVAYGMVAFAAAMATGKKGITLLIASGYAFASFVITSLAAAVDSLKFVDTFSLFHYYNNPQIMSNGLSLGYTSVLLAVIIILTIIGWIGFMRRDVRS